MLENTPATTIKGKKAIITRPISQPTTKARIMPATPILTFVKIEVKLFTKALWTFAI